MDDAELTIYVLPWGDSTYFAQVAVFAKRLRHEGEEFEIEITSYAMPSQLGLKTQFVNPTILGVLRTAKSSFDLSDELADCIFVGLHQVRGGRDMCIPVTENLRPPAEPTELARHAAGRFPPKSILRSELLAIPASRWKVSVRESSGVTGHLETALRLVNEDVHEAKVTLVKSFGGPDGTKGEETMGTGVPSFVLIVSNHAEAERAAAEVTSSEAQEWFETIMEAINDDRRRYQRGTRIRS